MHYSCLTHYDIMKIVSKKNNNSNIRNTKNQALMFLRYIPVVFHGLS
jgi:hypothetical protein